jgi:DNA-binding LacI/PurR family transcriptional regulator
MATIKKVAELAGVSVGTVSNVITGGAMVSEPLRVKVAAAIRELNYHPNFVARNLKTQRTRTVGIIVPDMTIPFFPQVIAGAESVARKAGYFLMAVNSGDDGARQRELLSLLRAQRVEGILLVLAAAEPPSDQILRMIEAGVAVVCLDRVPDYLGVDSVCVQNAAATRMAIEHLIGNGYRRIAIATGPLALRNESERLTGYREALHNAGLTFEPSLVWEGNLRPDAVCEMCICRLTRCLGSPEAIFSTNGPTALGVLRALRRWSLRVPLDIGFATFDELTVDDLLEPSITTVAQPAFEIGSRGAELLLNRLRSKDDAPARTLAVEANLRIGESSRRRT